MSAKAVVVFDPNGNVIPNAEVALQGMVFPNLTNSPDGYVLSPFSHTSGPTYVRVLATGYAPAVYVISLDDQNQEIHLGGDPNSGPPNTIHLPALSFKSAPLWRPSKEQVEKFKGAFCVPVAFNPGDPISWIDGLDHDRDRLWTPAMLAFTEECWDFVIDRYKQLNPHYTHFVINLGGSTYHDDYPHIPDDPAKARRLIVKLLNARLIPICCATDDENPDVVLESYKQNVDVIDCDFVMWEMNGPCNGDSNRMFAITLKVREASKGSSTFLHFTAGHGSMGEPEGEWWKKNQAIGVRGLFSQDDGFDRTGHAIDGDPQGTASGLEDTAAHLSGQRPGWEGCNLLNIAFEQCTTPVYHKYSGWLGTRPQKVFGNYLIDHCPSIAGYMDGGSY